MVGRNGSTGAGEPVTDWWGVFSPWLVWLLLSGLILATLLPELAYAVMVVLRVGASGGDMQSPQVVVASSIEAIDTATTLARLLSPDAHVTVWSGLPTAAGGKATFETFRGIADNSDFAIFVFSSDDKLDVADPQLVVWRRQEIPSGLGCSVALARLREPERGYHLSQSHH
jgi:hypothetical protein